MKIQRAREYFVTGIDTNIGKTWACGLLARDLLERGISCMTSKIVQTGGIGVSEDIQTHRSIMGMDLTDIDKDTSTCPFVFGFAASPHLAAHIEGRRFSPEQVHARFDSFSSKYEIVLIEGAGGIMVPLSDDYYTIDFIKERACQVLLVSSGRLGSINHTILSLDRLIAEQCQIAGIIYVQDPACHPTIVKDTRRLLAARYPQISILDMPWGLQDRPTTGFSQNFIKK